MKLRVSRLAAKFRSRRGSPRHEVPIYAELFSVERLEQEAEFLAAAHTVSRNPRVGARLSSRVHENGRALLRSYRAIGEAIQDEQAITPAVEWLVDNFHIVEDQLREIREDLPRGYYRALPKLAEGEFEGYPRVLALAWSYVAHSDSRFDPEALLRFVRAYQRVRPLTIGELWAIPITLRAVLVENLRRLAEPLVAERAARRQADAVADRVLGFDKNGSEPAEPPELRHPELPRAFTVRLLERLRDQDPAGTPPPPWLDQLLEAQGGSAEELVRAEHRTQAAMNVTVGNIITSMRQISLCEKLADVCFRLGRLDQERFWREKVYGSLQEAEPADR